MDPINQSFSGTKKQMMNAFPAALEALDMPLIGRNDELGLISFEREGKLMLYAHFVENLEKTSRVSIAPGLPYLKDRDSSEMPTSTIGSLMKELEMVMTNAS